MNETPHTEHSLDQLLAWQLPGWMKQSSPEALAELRAAMLQAEASHARLQALLGTLQSPQAFAEPLLVEALRTANGMVPQVYRQRLQRVWSTLEGLPSGTLPGRWRTHRLDQSLLEAALHNFDESEAGSGGAVGSMLLLDEAKRPLALAPERFARICRELDLGGRYQAYLQRHLEPADPQARRTLHDLLAQLQREELAVALQRARLSGDIDATAYRQLQTVVAPQALVPSDDRELRCRQLHLFGRPLIGVLVFEVRSPAAQVEAVIAYLPGAAGAPLKGYPSWAALYQELGRRCQDTAFVAFLQRFVRERDRPVFAANLARQNAVAGAHHSAIEGPLFATLCSQRIAFLKDNARLLAVPTADEDFAARASRLQGYASAGINLLNLAALFVPGLGELMLGLAVVQIASEVYEGFEDWRQGDRAGAVEHLLGVAENVAGMALIAAGGTATLSVLRRSGFVDALVPVQAASGRVKLMDAGLDGYRLADAAGRPGQLEQGNAGWQLRLHDGTYAVHRDEARGVWRIRHPQRPEAYSPVLESNETGGWHHPLDPPHHWQGAAVLLRRLSTQTADTSEAMAQQALVVTGFEQAHLRRLHLERRPPPARLLDALQRFELDAQLGELSECLQSDEPLPAALLRPQLEVLTALPGWPDDCALSVTAADGSEWHASASTAPSARTIRLELEHLRAADWPEPLLDSLGAVDDSRLLGQPRSSPEVNRQQLLHRMRSALLRRRVSLLEHAWRLRQVSVKPQVQLLRRDFPGLSVLQAEELLASLSATQQARLLETSRLPLTLTEQARWALRAARLDRAAAGFQRDGLLTADGETLALRLLGELAPWPAGQRVELWAAGRDGALLCAVGDAQATQLTRVYRLPQGYRRESAGTASAGDLFSVLAPLLSDSQRARLALPDNQSQSLRSALGARVAEDRERAARLLGQVASGFRPPVRVGDGRLGYPLSGRGNLQRTAINRSLREIYPTFTDEQASAYLEQVRVSGQSPWMHVFDRQQQLARLDSALNVWSSEPRRSNPGMAVARRRAAWLIRNCWRRQALQLSGRDAGYRLMIDEEPLGTLPMLHASVDFSHVSDLTLRSLELSEVGSGFLGRFSGVRWLSLSSNQLSAVPSVLARMPRLRHLELANNRISVTAADNATLAALPRLEVLNLNHNPIGPLLDLTPLTRLSMLELRATQINGLPQGLLSRSGLIAADLRGNSLERLPAEVFADGARLLQRLDVQDNPLSPATRARLAEFEQGSANGAAQAAADAQLLWLEAGTAEGELRQAQWARLAAEPGGEDFFRLLGDLAETAEYRAQRRELARRVWWLVEGCEQSALVRRELFELAARPRTCGDSVALQFSYLEVRLQVLEATHEVPADQLEPALLRLGRGLFRLDEVDRIAAQDIALRQAQGVEFDEIEVRLAYRVGLAQPLALPGQPTQMRFEQLAGVEPRQLLNARGRILAAEQTPRLLQTLAARDFWVAYLLEREAAAFEAVEQPFYARLDALTTASATLQDGIYLQRANAISAERTLARQALIDRLTAEAWQRFSGQGPQPGE